MRAAFPEAEERLAQFYAMQEYQLGWRDEQLKPANVDPGKLLRPYITLAACRAVGGDPARALPAAAAIQLVHDFSLIHDDIEDQSDLRRGRPTVWTLWGLAQGINTGDGMLIVAHLALYRLVALGVAPELLLDVMQRFDHTILTVCEGQFLDLSYEGNLAIDEGDYLAMISRKTAALIACAAEIGALIGGAAAGEVRAMGDFGRNLGIAFQIQDDVLGIWGDPAVTGKPAAADIQRRKLSLPVIHALTSAAQCDELAMLYRRPPTAGEDLTPIMAIIDGAGSRAYTEALAAHYQQQALDALDQLPQATPARDELRAMANRLLKRAN